METFSSPSSFANGALFRRVAVPADPAAVAARVIPRDTLAQARSAQDLMAMVAEHCAEVRAQARQAADALLAEAREEGRQLACQTTLDAQRQVWQQAGALLTQLEAERLALREQADELLRAMLVELSQRLLLNLPEAAPAMSSVRLLVEAWGHERAVGRASLSMHPDDLLAVTPLLATVPHWKVQPQSGLQRGDCVLAYDGLEMHASFTAHVAALTAAVASASPKAGLADEAVKPVSLPAIPTPSQELSV